MTLPKLPDNGPRNVGVSFRISKISADQLKALAKSNGLSQADVIEWLLDRECQAQNKKKSESKKEK